VRSSCTSLSSTKSSTSNSGTGSGGAEGSARPAPPRHPRNRAPPHPRNLHDLGCAAHQHIRGGPEDAPPQEASATHPHALGLGCLRGLDEPTVVLKEHLEHPAAAAGPLPPNSEVELLIVARLPDGSKVGVKSEVVGERTPEEDLQLRVVGQVSSATSWRRLVVLSLSTGMSESICPTSTLWRRWLACAAYRV
jgi:hypothetical protein